MNDVWDEAKVAFEGNMGRGGEVGGWGGGWGAELAHFVLHIPFVLKKQIGGAIWTLKHTMGDLFDTMWEYTAGQGSPYV